MLEQLFAAIDDAVDEDDVVLCVKGCRTDGAALNLLLEVRYDWKAERTVHSAWQVRCTGVHDVVLIPTGYGDIYLTQDHPLLIPFQADHTELYVSRRCVDPDQVIGRMYRAHQAVFGKWVHFDRFTTALASRVIDDGFGLLARGPMPLLNRYYEIVRSAGMQSSPLQANAPSGWNGQQWVDIDATAVHLLKIGGSHVIAETFECEAAKVTDAD